MANTLYDSARKSFALGAINWEDVQENVDSGVLTAFLVSSANSGYSYSSTHTTLGNVGTNRDFGTEGTNGKAIGTPTVQANGAVSGEDVRFTSVLASSPQVTGVIIAISTGVDADSPLIYFADTASGLPITPNGGDIIVTWNTGTNRIFRL